MVINDLVDVVASKARLTKKDATAAINAIFASIAEGLASGEEVKISGFGQFVVKETKARVGINPTTKERINIPESKKVTFKPSRTLKTLVRDTEVDDSDIDE